MFQARIFLVHSLVLQNRLRISNINHHYIINNYHLLIIINDLWSSLKENQDKVPAFIELQSGYDLRLRETFIIIIIISYWTKCSVLFFFVFSSPHIKPTTHFTDEETETCSKVTELEWWLTCSALQSPGTETLRSTMSHGRMDVGGWGCLRKRNKKGSLLKEESVINLQFYSYFIVIIIIVIIIQSHTPEKPLFTIFLQVNWVF